MDQTFDPIRLFTAITRMTGEVVESTGRVPVATYVFAAGASVQRAAVDTAFAIAASLREVRIERPRR